jgi:threonine/homoserine/homoserine lactone efflux protein
MAGDLIGFFVAATLLIIAPGPDTMLVMRNTLRGGRRIGMVTALGTTTGLCVWAVAAGVGLSALLEASRVGYDVLRVLGATYLIWLGVTSLRPGLQRRLRRKRALGSGDVPDRGIAAVAVPAIRITPWRAYLNGTVSDLCNPKIGVFFVAFLPGLIPASASASASARELSFFFGLWFAAETALWLSLFVWLVTRGVGLFSKSSFRRRVEQLTGVVLIGFGIRLATASRS